MRRDIYAHNILYDSARPGWVQLVDFGASYLLQPTAAHEQALGASDGRLVGVQGEAERGDRESGSEIGRRRWRLEQLFKVEVLGELLSSCLARATGHVLRV